MSSLFLLILSKAVNEVSCSYCVSLSSVIFLVNSRCSSLMHNHHQFSSVLTSLTGRNCRPASEGRDGASPSSRYESGFYSPYFIVPMKDSGLRLILDLRVLNPS